MNNNKKIQLPRYGLQWNGPKDFIPTEMDDGYWTPWHISNEIIEALQDEIIKLNKIIEND